MLFLIITIGDRYDGQISVPGGSNLRTFVLFSTLLHSNKDKKSLKALFLNFQTFLQGTHIESVVTHFEPPYLSPWLTSLHLPSLSRNCKLALPRSLHISR